MKPKTFVPDSFVEDPPSSPVVLVPDRRNGVAKFSGLDLSSNLQYDLDRAIESGNGGLIYNWFKRSRSRSRTETNQTRAAEISSIAGLITTYAAATATLDRLPHVLRQRHAIEDAGLRNQILKLDNEEKMVVVARALIEEAAKHGLPLEKYLLKLDKQIELDFQSASNTEAANHDRQLRANARQDERARAEDKITVLTTAKNVKRQQEKQLRSDLREALDRKHDLMADTQMSPAKRADLLVEVEDEIGNLNLDIKKLRKELDELGQEPREATRNER